MAQKQKRSDLFFFFVADALARGGGCRFALFIARLFVMLVLARFLEDAGLLDDFLEALQGAVQRLIGPYLYLRQNYPPSRFQSSPAPRGECNEVYHLA